MMKQLISVSLYFKNGKDTYAVCLEKHNWPKKKECFSQLHYKDETFSNIFQNLNSFEVKIF